MEMREKVFNAADRLESQGKAVTLASLREALGGGSYSTISPHQQKWKNMKIASAQLPSAPEDLSNRMFSLTSEIWNQAVQIAESRLASDRSVFEEHNRCLREDLMSATSAADRATEERDSATVRVKELEELIEATKIELATVLKRASDTDIRNKELERRVSDKQSEIDRLDRHNATLNAKNDTLMSALTAPKTSILRSAVPCEQP